MFDLIAGLPVHILVIHVVVVLGPLAAALAIAYTLAQKWRFALKWPTAALAVIAAVSTFVAQQSGEQLWRRVASQQLSAAQRQTIHAHVEYGNPTLILALAFAAATLIVVFWALPARADSPFSPVLRVLGQVLFIALCIAFIVIVVLAGHSGATAAWSGVSQ